MKIILGNRINNTTDDPLNPESQDDDKEKWVFYAVFYGFNI